jgi:inositol polyphosphate 5-phosphatase INPP5B/F
MRTDVPSLTIINDIDLNYRMDIPDHELRKTLRDDDWENESKIETLLRFDQVSLSYFLNPYHHDPHPLLTQLKKAIQSKRAFEGFQEAPITHMPYVTQLDVFIDL